MELLVEEAQEQGNIGPLLAEGISRPLAEALFSGLVQELQDLDEKGFERRSEAFLAYWRGTPKWDEEDQTKGDGVESIEDMFTNDIGDNLDEYVTHAMEMLEGDPILDIINEDLLREVLEDPEVYKFTVTQDGGSYHDSGLWHYDLGTVQNQGNGAKYNDTLRAALASMTDSDIEKAVALLADEEPYYLRFGSQYRKTAVDRDFFDSDSEYYFESSARVVADINFDVLIETLKEKLTESGGLLPEGTPDDVVYRYAGTNATVGGASARGMYVIALRPDQLRAEGAALGICVGRTDMGYRESLKKGQIKLYSIRTEAGKPKFTIEVDSRTQSIDQVKGKANRLPGFEPGKPTLSKPDEVRLVVEFLLSLGYTPDDIRAANDIRGGVRALEATGVDPFVPPPVRRRELQAPRPNGNKLAEAKRLVAEDYAHPWGGQWGACPI